MGAWNYAIFDDDTAYDALYDISESTDILRDMNTYFEQVLKAKYIDYDEGYYVFVSAAIMDCVLNNTIYRCDDETCSAWISSLKNLDFSPLKEKAIKAIDAVLSDHSELTELWKENEELYDTWRLDKIALRNRLMQ